MLFPYTLLWCSLWSMTKKWNFSNTSCDNLAFINHCKFCSCRMIHLRQIHLVLHSHHQKQVSEHTSFTWYDMTFLFNNKHACTSIMFIYTNKSKTSWKYIVMFDDEVPLYGCLPVTPYYRKRRLTPKDGTDSVYTQHQHQ